MDGCAGKVTAHREPYADDIEKLCIAAHFGDAKLWASTQSYADAYCVLSRTASKEEVKKAFAATLEFFLVVEIYAAGLKPALESDCGDFEDYLVAHSARRSEAQFFITCGKKLVERCPVKALTVAERPFSFEC